MTSQALRTIRILAVSIAVWTLIGIPAPPAPGPVPGVVLADTASSQSELIERFLGALSRKDPDALHALRASESEWRAMLEWQVPPGKAPRIVRPDVQDLAWGMLDTKSRYYERYLIQNYGGRRFDVKTVAFEKGTTEWAGYRVHGQLRLSLVEDGKDLELGTGSIVEVDGRYKFGSFVRD